MALEIVYAESGELYCDRFPLETKFDFNEPRPGWIRLTYEGRCLGWYQECFIISIRPMTIEDEALREKFEAEDEGAETSN